MTVTTAIQWLREANVYLDRLIRELNGNYTPEDAEIIADIKRWIGKLSDAIDSLDEIF